MDLTDKGIVLYQWNQGLGITDLNIHLIIHNVRNKGKPSVP